VGYKAATGTSLPSSSVDFHLNHVGYKALKHQSFENEDIFFHLNHVGYKAALPIDSNALGALLSSEPCGI